MNKRQYKKHFKKKQVKELDELIYVLNNTDWKKIWNDIFNAITAVSQKLKEITYKVSEVDLKLLEKQYRQKFENKELLEENNE